MNKEEEILQLKLTALNAIKKIYHPLTNNHYSKYTDMDGSYSEQRDSWIRDICKTLDRDLIKLKLKYKKK